jgi:Flp pilus assembly protein TadD
MHRRSFSMRHGLIALALVIAPLAGCTTANFAGKSAFGDNKLQVAEISDLGSYTAERALREARAHFRNNDFGHSAALYKRAVELRPKDTEALVGLGASYDRLRRFDLSDRVYASLYKLSGDTVQYHNNVGYSQMLRGNLKDALASFRRAKSIDPGNVVVANNLEILSKVAAKARA